VIMVQWTVIIVIVIGRAPLALERSNAHDLHGRCRRAAPSFLVETECWMPMRFRCGVEYLLTSSLLNFTALHQPYHTPSTLSHSSLTTFISLFSDVLYRRPWLNKW
jgi:hypothetical protein